MLPVSDVLTSDSSLLEHIYRRCIGVLFGAAPLRRDGTSPAPGGIDPPSASVGYFQPPEVSATDIKLRPVISGLSF